jgi:hypothetical protein
MIHDIEHAEAFAIFDIDSGNALASFTDFDQAQETFAAMVDVPVRRLTLSLVGFDKTGHTIGVAHPEDLPPGVRHGPIQ